ncbi:uncharacterized protein LOC122508390 [Leptopilina heterotoma]|uniref:uncharacterized protein LOC122508390 n=1 Tax=Leptopilina heterotoma TaxID=63436 RepID=UPI001CA9A84E|nr:uncharacterized protein LOC122508390 [Leptopilina heterotoma]
MYFFKSFLLVAFLVISISWTSAQLSEYKKLTNDDFGKLCEKNNVDLKKLYKESKVEDLFSKNIVAIENPEKIQHCLGNSLHELLQNNMQAAKKCVQGSIKLDDNSIKQLVDESEERLCALFRLASYELYLNDVNKNLELDSNASNIQECSNIMDKRPMENFREFDNLGLSYSPEGVKLYENIFNCVSLGIKKSNDKDQNAKRESLMKEYIATLKVSTL